MLRALDGPALSQLVAGRALDCVLRSDQLLVIRCTDGTEVRVAWVDDNGEPVAGRPAIAFAGRHVIAAPGVVKVVAR